MRIFEVYKNQKNLEKGHVALRYKDTVVTYEDLAMYVDKYAAYFQSIGVKKGDRIAISSPNCPEFVYSYLGASKAGAIVVPLNMMLTLQEIGYILKESGTSTIVMHPEVLQRIDPACLPLI